MYMYISKSIYHMKIYTQYTIMISMSPETLSPSQKEKKYQKYKIRLYSLPIPFTHKKTKHQILLVTKLCKYLFENILLALYHSESAMPLSSKFMANVSCSFSSSNNIKSSKDSTHNNSSEKIISIKVVNENFCVFTKCSFKDSIYNHFCSYVVSSIDSLRHK